MQDQLNAMVCAGVPVGHGSTGEVRQHPWLERCDPDSRFPTLPHDGAREAIALRQPGAREHARLNSIRLIDLSTQTHHCTPCSHEQATTLEVRAAVSHIKTVQMRGNRTMAFGTVPLLPLLSAAAAIITHLGQQSTRVPPFHHETQPTSSRCRLSHTVLLSSTPPRPVQHGFSPKVSQSGFSGAASFVFMQISTRLYAHSSSQ